MPDKQTINPLHQYEGKTVLITGGLGFIGRNLTARLVGLRSRVLIVNRLSSVQPANTDESLVSSGSVEVFYDDLRNMDLLRRLVGRSDIIFNLAGQANHTETLSEPARDFDVTCLGQLSLLEACKSVKSDIRIVFASSRLVYGRGLKNPVNVSAQALPNTIYGIHKLTVEHYHRLYAELVGLKTISLRITNPYGPGQRPNGGKHGIVNWFMKLAHEDADLCVFGDGSQVRDYIYIDDLIEIMLRGGFSPRMEGQVLNAGFGAGVPFRQMAELVVEVVGKGRVKLVPWPEKYLKVETGDFIPDVSRTVDLIGYRASTELREGLVRMLRSGC